MKGADHSTHHPLVHFADTCLAEPASIISTLAFAYTLQDGAFIYIVSMSRVWEESPQEIVHRLLISGAFLLDTSASHSLIRRIATEAINDTARETLNREFKREAEHQNGQTPELLNRLINGLT